MHAFPLERAHDQDCTECHQVPRNYSIFSCTHCHEHNRRDTDDDHDDVSGYVYSSPACYSCHPDGDD